MGLNRTAGVETSVDRARRRAAGLALGLAAISLAACQRDEVAHYRVPKVGGEVMASAGVQLPPPPAPKGGLRWTLPPGWKEAAGGQMRYATLTAPVPGKVDVSVVVLPGDAGGELANVNRWRNQIGLAPLADGELPSVKKVVKSGAGDLNVYDFTSEGQKRTRTIAGLASIEGSTWFVKMTGDAEPVASARASFLDLLGSLHLENR